MNFKKAGLTGIAILTAVAAAACSNSNQTQGEQQSAAGNGANAQTESNGKLTFWGGANLTSAVQVVMEDYSKKHPDLQISYQKFPYAEYPTKMKLQLASEQNEPDVMIIHDFLAPQFIKSGWLLDLTDAVKKEDFLPSSLDAVSSGGKLYGLPNQSNLGTFLYRKDIFDRLGLQAPKTLEDYLTAAQKLKDNGYFIGAMNPNNAPDSFITFLLQSGGAIFDDKGNVILNTPEGKGVETLNLMKKMQDAGYFSPVTNLSQEFWTSVNAGKIVANLTVSSDAANYNTGLDPQGNGGYGKWSYATPPKLAENGPVAFNNNTEYYVINKNTKNPEAAKALIKYLASSEEAGKAFSEIEKPGLVVRMTNNYIPSLQKLSEESAPWKAFGDQKIISQEAKTLLETKPRLPYTDERADETKRIIGSALAKFFNGGMSSEDTIKNVTDQIKNIKR